MSLKRTLADDVFRERWPSQTRLTEPEHAEYSNTFNDNYFLDLGAQQDSYEDVDIFEQEMNIDSSLAFPQVWDTSTQDEQICYGTFFNEKVQLVGQGQDLQRRIQELRTGGQTHTLQIKHSNQGQLFLKFSDATNLGLLCEKMERGLTHLISDPLIELDAVVNLIVLVEAIRRARKSSEAVIRVNINVYGPASKAVQFGQELSNNSLFLQEPNERRSGTRYDNPHILRLEGIEEWDTETQEVASEDEEAAIAISDQNDDFQATIAEIFNSLKRSSDLHRLEGSVSLKKGLYPHQEEALDFMLQRETGDIPLKYRLWKPKIVNEVIEHYYHVITNSHQKELPDESGGGILADEMGMGKSLTTLVLIEKTLVNAGQWIQEQDTQMEVEGALTKRRCRATLVVVPSQILINTWMNEIEKHLGNNLTVFKYHGSGRHKLLRGSNDFDIFITTYNTLTVEHLAKEKGKRNSLLHEFEWYRVVLDEAHFIRRASTTFHRAVRDLSARNRWCLSGTPIQNNLSDLGSLLSFIQVKPFQNLSIFRHWISSPFDKTSKRHGAVERLVLLLEGICLRRTIECVDLPRPKEETHMIEFTPEERKQYNGTRKAMKRLIDQQPSEYNEHAFGMFQVFLELRSICNHGTYQRPFSWSKSMLLDEEAENICSMERTSLNLCLVCKQPLPIILWEKQPTWVKKCKHFLCSSCFQTSTILSNPDEEPNCPVCDSLKRPPLYFDQNSMREREVASTNDTFREQGGYSSKMRRLVSDVKKDVSYTKSIIFSCWTSTLDLIGYHLKGAGIAFARVDGKTLSSQRQHILDDFNDTNKISVLIMTTGTGAFGLNLQSANRVFIVEPQWNPSVEVQAIARVIRLGQDKKVVVTRYRVKESFEENMFDQQKKKLEMSKMDFKKYFSST